MNNKKANKYIWGSKYPLILGGLFSRSLNFYIYFIEFWWGRIQLIKLHYVQNHLRGGVTKKQKQTWDFVQCPPPPPSLPTVGTSGSKTFFLYLNQPKMVLCTFLVEVVPILFLLFYLVTPPKACTKFHEMVFIGNNLTISAMFLQEIS